MTFLEGYLVVFAACIWMIVYIECNNLHDSTWREMRDYIRRRRDFPTARVRKVRS